MKNYTILIKYNEKEPVMDCIVNHFKAKSDAEACCRFHEIELEHKEYIKEIKLLYDGKVIIEDYL